MGGAENRIINRHHTTPVNITNIHNIDIIPTTPPQYLQTPVNIYEFLLSPLISANPSTHSLIPTAPPIHPLIPTTPH